MKPGQAVRAEDIGAWRQLGDAASILRSLPRCEGEVRRHAFEALRSLGSPVAGAMVQVLGLGRRPEQSESQAMERSWSRMAQAGLLAGLKSPDVRMRSLAARTLGELDELEALEPLLVQLDREPAQMARLELEQAVERLSGKEGAERIQLLHWARTGRWDLCLARGEAAQPVLVELAVAPSGDAEGHRQRTGAIARLVQHGGTVVLPALRSLLEDPVPQVRKAAVDGLSLLGEVEQEVPRLALRLGDWDEAVRLAALDALARLGGSEAEQALERFAGQCGELPLRYALAEVLGRFGRLDLLDELLHDAQPEVRKDAAAALGRTGQRRAIDLLVAALDDAYPEVRHAARRSLEQLGWRPVGFRKDRRQAGYQRWTVPADWRATEGQSQLEVLLAALSSPEEDLRRNAADALGDLGERGAVELLRALLDDPVADVALVAARSLVALGETPAAEPRWAPHLALT
ncbi:MAG: HEAT repeat domain-containing protein, partial [Deltaproteobacteria bacterium]|nr:HEAT repeat domain-containing protein [Deltaproteobacteria bacterium]